MEKPSISKLIISLDVSWRDTLNGHMGCLCKCLLLKYGTTGSKFTLKLQKISKMTRLTTPHSVTPPFQTFWHDIWETFNTQPWTWRVCAIGSDPSSTTWLTLVLRVPGVGSAIPLPILVCFWIVRRCYSHVNWWDSHFSSNLMTRCHVNFQWKIRSAG